MLFQTRVIIILFYCPITSTSPTSHLLPTYHLSIGTAHTDRHHYQESSHTARQKIHLKSTMYFMTSKSLPSLPSTVLTPTYLILLLSSFLSQAHPLPPSIGHRNVDLVPRQSDLSRAAPIERRYPRPQDAQWEIYQAIEV